MTEDEVAQCLPLMQAMLAHQEQALQKLPDDSVLAPRALRWRYVMCHKKGCSCVRGGDFLHGPYPVWTDQAGERHFHVTLAQWPFLVASTMVQQMAQWRSMTIMLEASLRREKER